MRQECSIQCMLWRGERGLEESILQFVVPKLKEQPIALLLFSVRKTSNLALCGEAPQVAEGKADVILFSPNHFVLV